MINISRLEAYKSLFVVNEPRKKPNCTIFKRKTALQNVTSNA